MAIDYDEFRRTTWAERVAIFNALSPEGMSELFRSQVAGWIERHSEELSSAQVDLLHEAMEAAVPELYVDPKPDAAVARIKGLEGRAKELFTREQMIDSLTFQWGMT